MDPNVALSELIKSIQNGNAFGTHIHADALAGWLAQRGFTPEVSGAQLGEICRYIAWETRQTT